MKNVVIIALLAISMNVLVAQENKIELSLNEAQEYALQHNKTLINSNRDLILADAQIKESKGSGLPQVNASLDYTTNFNYEIEFGLGGGSTQPPDIDYSLLDAGDYEVFKAIDQMFGSSEGTKITMGDQLSARLQVTQLIFNGQYWVGIEMAKLGKKIAEKNITSTSLDIKENVANSYYLVLVTKELLKILEENQKNLEEVLKHTSNMYRVGTAEQTDVDQLKITLSQIENSKKAMERNLQLNLNMFKFTLGIAVNDDISLTDSLHSFTDSLDSENLVDLEMDLTKNPTYEIMVTQEELSEKAVNLQRWAYAPTLSAYYSYTEKLITSGFDLSPKNSAGLTLSIPILSGGVRKAKLSQAKVKLDKISTSKTLLEEQLAIQDNQLTFEVKNAYDNYATQKESVEIAKRVYNNINNKYQQGLVSSLDLTQANSNYLQAENNYISSILSLLQARLKMDKLYNNL